MRIRRTYVRTLQSNSPGDARAARTNERKEIDSDDRTQTWSKTRQRAGQPTVKKKKKERETDARAHAHAHGHAHTTG